MSRAKRTRDAIPEVIDKKACGADILAKAEAFSAYFHCVFSQSKAIIPKSHDVGELTQMRESELSEDGITLLLKKINIHSATSPDFISNFFLKSSALLPLS